MTSRCGAGGGEHVAWYEPVLESIRDGGLAASGAGAGMFDRHESPPRRPCLACDDDPFLSRWEDDGGGLGPLEDAGRPRRPPAEQRRLVFQSLEETPR